MHVLLSQQVLCCNLCPTCSDRLCLTLVVWLTDFTICSTCGLHRSSYKVSRDTVTQGINRCAMFPVKTIIRSGTDGLALPSYVSLQVASGSSRKASSSMSMSMDLQSAMKCQASFLRQILQPAIVDKVCLRVSTMMAAMQMGQSEQHASFKYKIIHGMHLPPGPVCVAHCAK